MNEIDLTLNLRSHSNCIDNIYYIFFIKINNLGINIQEQKEIYNIDTGNINKNNYKNLLIIVNNKPFTEPMMLFLYKTFKNFEYAYNLRNFILNILPLLL